MPDASSPVIELRNVTKRFPGVLANDQVDLGVHAGEVHVLLGENGAGKSTLIAMLSGLLQPDAGEIRLDGAPVRIASPKRALQLGIGTVFQHSMLVPTLTVAQNLSLGAPWWALRREEAVIRRFEALCADFGVRIDPHRVTGALSLGEQQQVEIFRALLRGSRVLVLDEATSMLTPQGVAELGALMRNLARRSMAVILITHKLREAFDFGDRISILRLGRKVAELGPDQLRDGDEHALHQTVVRSMFGGATGTTHVRRPAAADGAVRPPVLEVRGLSVPGVGDGRVSGASFAVRAGEILGIAGIDGNGQKQLAEALAGQIRASAGEILLDGRPIGALEVGARRRLGLRYVTDDRLGEGTVGTFPIAINLLLKEVGRDPFWRRGIEQPGRIRDHACRLVEEFDVRTPDAETPIGRLSGGNIQKAVLARELFGGARVVVYNKPTYGLDVQNIASARRRLSEAADAGVATVLISTDLDEILDLSDRIAVMAGGRIVGIVDNDGDARSVVAELMVGDEPDGITRDGEAA
ncbi:putative B6 ABC transporter ATP-binding protein [Azospirillum sp. ST 5-10]|uniref:putative B6 ABC transporter ATP-binding protein n=1 Tax=unclassified Azospirillum TaxID=2630922 RepID=UPI003F49E13E